MSYSDVVRETLEEHIDKCYRMRNTAISLGWHKEAKVYDGIIAELNDIKEELC